MKFLIEIVLFLISLNFLSALRKKEKDAYLVQDYGDFMAITEYPDDFMEDGFSQSQNDEGEEEIPEENTIEDDEEEIWEP
jgi:hypothetical protein